jgi:hypothetical protein
MTNDIDPVPGNHERRDAGPVAIMCMAPEARDLMEVALKKYQEHCASIRKTWPAHRGSVYSFAYWLFRWSGLVTVNGNSASPKEGR